MKAKIVLEFGNHWLKLLALKPWLKGKPQIKKLLLKDISAFTDEQLSDILQDMLKESRLKLSPLIICLPRNQVMMKTLRFPSVEPREIDKMLSLHVGRQVSYPKEEIVYGYEAIGVDEIGYTKILLAIVHRNIPKRILNILFKLNLFPAGGAYSLGVMPSLSPSFIIDFLWHYTLPFLSIVLISLGGRAIGMRTMLIYELGSDYMNYCETLGFKDRRLIMYAFRNAILPQITGLATSLARTVSGQVVVETVFGYPGVGYIMYQGIMHEDYPLIEGSFIILISCVLLMNFLMDILYAYIDPRIKAVYSGER